MVKRKGLPSPLLKSTDRSIPLSSLELKVPKIWLQQYIASEQQNGQKQSLIATHDQVDVLTNN